jgi:peptidoglycan/xylan/chitin deacetylase (PgdA/CDA1 family)
MAVSERPPWWRQPRSAAAAGRPLRCSRCICFGQGMKLFMILTAAAILAFCVRCPHLIARHLAGHLAREVLWSVRSSTRVVALTFDDGPHPATTPALVDLLDRYRARATFFLIGVNASRHEDLVRQIVDSGHELGNHLLSDYPSILLSATEFQAQLLGVDATLRRFGTVRYFRPGSGFFTPRMLRIAADSGYRCALGTISTLDINSRNPQSVARRIAGKVRPGDVVVLHEGSPDRTRIVTVVESLLADLTARGYRFVTLTEMAGRPALQ